MKPIYQYLLLAALLLAVIYPSVYLPGVVHETRQLTHQMNGQLDSLKTILYRYDQTLNKYDTAYDQLIVTKKKLDLIQLYFEQQHTSQQSDLAYIVSQLQELSFSEPTVRQVPTYATDSLLFQP